MMLRLWKLCQSFAFCVLTIVKNCKYIFIDEVGFNLVKRRRQGRNVIAQRTIVEVPVERGGNITLCAAMGWAGLLTVLYCSKNKTFFAAYVCCFLFDYEKMWPTLRHFTKVEMAHEMAPESLVCSISRMSWLCFCSPPLVGVSVSVWVCLCLCLSVRFNVSALVFGHYHHLSCVNPLITLSI